MPGECKHQDVDPTGKEGVVRPQEALDGFLDALLIGRLELDHQVEAAPQRRIDQFRVVGGRQQYAAGGPFIDLLQDYSDKALEFAHVGVVAAPLGDGINLVQQQHAGLTLGEVDGGAQVGAALAQQAAHHGGQIEHVQRHFQLCGQPAGRERLADSGRPHKDCRTGGRETHGPEPIALPALCDELRQDLLDLTGQQWCVPRRLILEHLQKREAGFVVDRQALGRRRRRRQLAHGRDAAPWLRLQVQLELFGQVGCRAPVLADQPRREQAHVFRLLSQSQANHLG